MKTYTALEVVALFDKTLNVISDMREVLYQRRDKEQQEGRKLDAVNTLSECIGMGASLVAIQDIKMQFFNESRSS